MIVKAGRLNGVYTITPHLHEDHRGFFAESYNKDKMSEQGLVYDFVQDNHALSKEAGTLRGLHYQLPPKAQAKLVRVLAGAIYDVVVDIRRGSPTFGGWQGFILSESNRMQLLVPPGFAHGYCTLTPNTQVFYKVDQFYAPNLDRGIRWDDADIGIEWPVSNPLLSGKDMNHPAFEQAEHFS